MHTMKDEFMIVSGMPERNGDRHVSEIASMALDLLAGIDTTSLKLDMEHQTPEVDFLGFLLTLTNP